MRRLLSVLIAVVVLGGCDLFDSRPTYSGPDDYAYTLTVGCFCPYVGPLRITVRDGEVVDVVQLDPRDDSSDVDPFIEEQAMTLVELGAFVDRAYRGADDVEADYDPTYGFPTDVSIDWYKDAVDDEIGYTVRDYTPL